MGFEEQGTAGKGFLANFGRRQLIIVGTVLLIGAAVAVNWLMFSGEGEGGYDGYQSASDLITSHGSADEKNNLSAGQEGTEGDEVTDVSDSYFASTQVSRQRARDEAIEVLQGVIDNEKSDDATKAQALADISQIWREIFSPSSGCKASAGCCFPARGPGKSIEMAQKRKLLRKSRGY